jgi:hypothetical protein
MSTSCSWLEGSESCPSAGTGIDAPFDEEEGAESEPLEDDDVWRLGLIAGVASNDEGERERPRRSGAASELVLMFVVEEEGRVFEGVC